MDFSSITTVFSMVKGAQELASAAMGVKNFNESAATISEINQKLLAAQQGLLAHNTMLLQLQGEYFQATEELRKIKEALAEKQRYLLVEISPKTFVYRVNLTPDSSRTDEPRCAEPVHHLCQPCFDKGVKSVLQNFTRLGVVNLRCTVCGQDYDSGERKPMR